MFDRLKIDVGQTIGQHVFNRLISIAATLALLVGCGTAEQQPDIRVPFDPAYEAYGRILRTAVQGEMVDYQALVDNRAVLDTFIYQLATLSTEEYERLDRYGKMALWINAYNGITLRSVVDAYPVETIKDINGVWDSNKWRVAGRMVTLDDIEHKILRPEFKDARVHVAVNCASKGCPPLHGYPIIGSQIDGTLDVLSRQFVNDPERTIIDVDNATILVTEIFSWFGDDLIPQYSSLEGHDHLSAKKRAVIGFVSAFANESTRRKLISVKKWQVEYIPYDWALNDTAD
jgi:hypothetical protein